MRLIHSARRPSNTSLLRQFQQCQVNKILSVRLHPVFVEASTCANGTNILCHGRSYAASASSDAMESRKPRRRVSKNERKSMLENYVKKYRETNGGKFPTTSVAVRDIGGCYYVVRQMLQEVIHNDKQASVNTKQSSLEKSTTKKDEIFTNIREVSQTSELGKVVRPNYNVDVASPSSKVFVSKQGQQSPVSVETAKSKDDGTHSDHLIGKPQSSHPDTENNVKQEKLENMQKFDRLEPEAGPHESTEPSRREPQKVPTGDVEPQEKPSMWNNLKSLANGILNLWKRS